MLQELRVHQRQMEYLVVVVQACLAMQLVTTTKHTPLFICNAVAHTPQAGMYCRHGTHSTWLLYHIAVKACAQVGPAKQHSACIV